MRRLVQGGARRLGRPGPALALTLLFLLLVLHPAAGQEPEVRGSVTRVIDGDTIEVDPIGTVRLIGVDTPELGDAERAPEGYAREAAAYTSRRLLGQTVRLEFDWQRRDGYGRALAYVYLVDGTLFNAELVREGYAFALTRYPFRHLEQFRRYEREARERGAGLWSEAAARAPGTRGDGEQDGAGEDAEAVVPVAEARAHVGKYVTVEGRVESVFTSERGNTFLNFGAPYPAQTFSAVVFRSSASRFGDLHRLTDRVVGVTGREKLYRGKPEIVLERPSQLAEHDSVR